MGNHGQTCMVRKSRRRAGSQDGVLEFLRGTQETDHGLGVVTITPLRAVSGGIDRHCPVRPALRPIVG